MFDQELTTRRGYTENAQFVCIDCGEVHTRLMVRD